MMMTTTTQHDNDEFLFEDKVDLEQPLLMVDNHSEDVSLDNDDESSDDDDDDDYESNNKKGPVATEIPKYLYWKFFFIGAFLGMMTQTLSIGVTGVIIAKWGTRYPIEFICNYDRYSYYFLWFISKFGYWFYRVIVFFPIIFVLTPSGIETFKIHILKQSVTTKTSSTTRRSAFLTGVSTFTGVVVGSFITWVSIEIYLKSPYLLLPTCTSLFVCLVLCYAMVLVFDKDLNH